MSTLSTSVKELIGATVDVVRTDEGIGTSAPAESASRVRREKPKGLHCVPVETVSSVSVRTEQM